MNPNDLKLIVKEKYGKIASESTSTKKSCCCKKSDDALDYSIFSQDYTQLEGYVADADLNLGCGIPTEFAQIRTGNTVLDLGSGAGNDCFVARSLVGETGKVIGLDFTAEMVEKARINQKKLGYGNVEFIMGDIEEMPIHSQIIDVIISNCVLNLVPNKEKAFSEIYRVLKKGGHFCVSDIVLEGELPARTREVAALYAGCVSGASQKNEYLTFIQEAGFVDIEVVKDRALIVPDEILEKHLSQEELIAYKNSGAGIFSITVQGRK